MTRAGNHFNPKLLALHYNVLVSYATKGFGILFEREAGRVPLL
jgi:hypothetical protein